MISVKDFLKLLKQGYWLSLYVDDKISLSCSVEYAISLFKFDKRGELLINDQSIAFKDEYYGPSGVHNKTIIIHCSS